MEETPPRAPKDITQPLLQTQTHVDATIDTKEPQLKKVMSNLEIDAMISAPGKLLSKHMTPHASAANLPRSSSLQILQNASVKTKVPSNAAHHRESSKWQLFTDHSTYVDPNGSKPWKFILSLRRFTFYQLHLAHFLFWTLVGTIGIWIAEKDRIGVSFIDALFSASSAMTCSGLVVLDIATVSSGTIVIFWILILLGSPVLLTAGPLMIRIAILREEILQHEGRNQERKVLDVNILKLNAMRRLFKLVLLYFAVVQIFGFILFLLYITFNPKANQTMNANGVVSPAAFSLFHTSSAFNNAGLSLFTGNLVPYVDDGFILIITGAQILFGNTLYPIALRFLIKFLRRITKSDLAKNEYSFLLLNSRECFTHLFPEINTQIVASSIFLFNFVQWVISNLLILSNDSTSRFSS
jgi:Trk-type K+ transport system membrane component